MSSDIKHKTVERAVERIVKSSNVSRDTAHKMVVDAAKRINAKRGER